MNTHNAFSRPPDLIPLFRVFDLLHHNGFALGIDDYYALLAVLANWNGILDRSRLLLICKLLWLKNQEQEPLFNNLFSKGWEKERMKIAQWQAAHALAQQRADRSKQAESEAGQTDYKQTIQESAPKSTNETPSEFAIPDTPAKNSQPVYGKVQISIESSASPTNLTVDKNGLQDAQKNYLTSGSWLDVKDRDLMQRFRFLRRLESQGIRASIDIPATVRKISNEGQFYEPVWECDRKNTARLLVLADHEGSMVAFSELTDTIARSANMSQGLINEVFYFNNLPGEYVWRNKMHTSPIPTSHINEALKQPNTWLLIISDAGAARGRYNPTRVDATARWLSNLSTTSRSIAWINPLPDWRWQDTSAAAVAKLVAMFEATPQGVRNVVRFFKGSSYKIARHEYSGT